MFTLRPANQRGHTLTDWLDSYHTFSFGQYYNPDYMGFGVLRVINDDIVAPDMGFGLHPHANMEIISVILSGRLEHKDSLGSGSILKVGDIQKMSAGSGIYHSEFNPSSSESVHFLQIWILPDIKDIKPSYEDKHFDRNEMLNRLCYIATPDGRHNSFIIHQNCEMFQCLLQEKQEIIYKLDSNRRYWLQMALGNIELNGQIMVAGDSMAIAGEDVTMELRGIDKESNFLLFNLPA